MFPSHNFDLYDVIEKIEDWLGRNAVGFASYLVRKFGGVDAAKRVIKDHRRLGQEIVEKIPGMGLGAIAATLSGFGAPLVGAMIGAGVMEIFQDILSATLDKIAFDSGAVEKFRLTEEWIVFQKTCDRY